MCFGYFLFCFFNETSKGREQASEMKTAFLFCDQSKYSGMKSNAGVNWFLNHLYEELILCNYWGVTLNSGQDFVAW